MPARLLALEQMLAPVQRLARGRELVRGAVVVPEPARGVFCLNRPQSW